MSDQLELFEPATPEPFWVVVHAFGFGPPILRIDASEIGWKAAALFATVAQDEHRRKGTVDGAMLACRRFFQLTAGITVRLERWADSTGGPGEPA